MAADRWEERVQRAWIFAGNQKWVFDAVVRESHHHEVAVTMQPVETGVPVSDHAFTLPWHLEIEAVVTDWARGPNEPIPSDPFAGEAGRSVRAVDLILSLMDLAEPFQIQTGMRLYDDAIITTFDFETDARNASAVHFRAGIQRVIRVSTETTTYTPRADKKTKNQASKTASAGEKKPPPTPPATLESIAHDLTLGDQGAFTKALSFLSGGG